MAEIDISNIISVSLSANPITMKQANLSTIAIFTTEDGVPTADGKDVEPYTIYRTPNAVAQDYGTESEVYKQAAAIFAQAPNILTANGYLIVIPMLPSVTIAATAGYAVCSEINLQNFKYVTDGSINFNVDGNGARALTGLNFTGASTTQKLCAVFNDAFNALAKGYTIATPAIDYNDFSSVSNGSFIIQTGSSESVEVSGLDFTGITSLSDLADVIQTGLTADDVPVTATADTTNQRIVFETDAKGATTSLSIASGSTGTDIVGSSYLNIAAGTQTAGTNAMGCTAAMVDGQLKFTSNTTGASSSVVLTSNTTGTDLSDIAYLDVASIVNVQGVAAYTGRERLADAIIRTQAEVYYNGILVDHSFDDDDELLNASDYVQTQSKMLFVANNDIQCCDDGLAFSRIQGRRNTHTRCIAYFSDTLQKARLVAAAYASRGLCVDFGGSNTTLTMQLKELATIEADPNATETLVQKAKNVGADMYVSVDGVPCTFSHGANEFFDNVYNDIWLKTALQVAGFNCLKNASSKIPQTAAGLETLISAYVEVLNRGIKNGAFAAGSWTLPVTFGDPIMLKQSVASVGYYVYATPITEQSQEERDERKAPFIQMAIKRAGAIHSSNILVYINN